MTKYLCPDLCPGIDRRSFAIIILVEPVLPTIVIEDFKAVKGVNGLVAFGLLAVAKDHTKRILVVGIISLILFIIKGEAIFPMGKRWCKATAITVSSRISNM